MILGQFYIMEKKVVHKDTISCITMLSSINNFVNKENLSMFWYIYNFV